MAITPSDLQQPTELSPARRNRYYYGKLMDVLHFSMEQRYVLSKEWLYNWAVLGPGVVCGLGVDPVTTSAGNGIVVRAGLAVDGWGREIVVPEDVTLVPLQLTDQCGQPPPAGTPVEPLPSAVTVQVCYAECLTDFSPALVSDDCGCGDCEAGTVIETYCLQVAAGTADPVADACMDAVLTGLKAGQLHDVLCTLAASCTTPAQDPCLTLANVTVAADGTLTIDSTSPRVIAPTNRILAQLVACLAQCCAGMAPPTANLLEVNRVDLVAATGADDTSATVLATLNPPSHTWQYTAAKQARPDGIDVTFTGATLDNSTVTLALPNTTGTFQVAGTNLEGAVLGFPAPNVVRLFIKDMQAGTYRFRLVGTPDATSANLAIMSEATSSAAASDLDGEITTPPKWPSGNGQPGGDFGPVELQIR